MKIEIEIEVYDDKSYSTLSKRKLTMEAAQLPSSIGALACDIVNQTISEAKDEKKLRALRKSEQSTSPVAPASTDEF